jgi:hypothetical protein
MFVAVKKIASCQQSQLSSIIQLQPKNKKLPTVKHSIE